MGLFDKRKKAGDQNQDDASNHRSFSSVFDLFPNTDFENFPDASFVKGHTETNEKEQKLVYYRKNLIKKECNLFDLLEIVVIEDSLVKTFIYSVSDVKSINLKALAKLIDNFYLFYGSDISERGKFTSSDIEEFNDGYWIGRFWSSEEKGYQAVFSMDEQKLSLSMLKLK